MAPVDDELTGVLAESQRLGFLGASLAIVDVVVHARAFVGALHEVVGSVADLGAGGGVPGLVIAHDRPDLGVTLIERRQTRADFLRRVVARLGWNDRVRVEESDAERLAEGKGERYDAVVARGFGPPERTLRVAGGLTSPGGLIVISEPPAGDRWESTSVDRRPVVSRRILQDDPRVIVFVRGED